MRAPLISARKFAGGLIVNNVKKSIGWCDYTWNPITGCKRACEYCYARKIHNRFSNEPFSKIVFHPDRLIEPIKVKKPSKIFVGSMSDIEYWNINDIEEVLYIVNKCQQHTFMFLSKNPLSYTEPSRCFGWPNNTMQGLTVEIPSNGIMIKMIHKINFFPRPYLSIEPIAGGLYEPVPEKMELVIVGAETGNRKDKIIPQQSWIESIRENCPAEKVFWKDNIKKYL